LIFHHFNNWIFLKAPVRFHEPVSWLNLKEYPTEYGVKLFQANTPVISDNSSMSGSFSVYNFRSIKWWCRQILRNCRISHTEKFV